MSDKYTVKVLTCDTPNHNGRIYPKEIVEQMIHQTNIQKPIPGYLGIPEERIVENCSHICSNLLINENCLFADVTFLDNKMGIMAKKLFEQDVLYFGTAGVGNINNNIISDYTLHSIDGYLKHD